MIKEILSILFLIILYFKLNTERVLVIDPTVKMVKKNVTYFDSENMYKLKKLK